MLMMCFFKFGFNLLFDENVMIDSLALLLNKGNLQLHCPLTTAQTKNNSSGSWQHMYPVCFAFSFNVLS